MTTITTRAGKGSPLLNSEVDANFTNLNDDKAELSGASFTGNVSFGDNVKATFGANDLQIYHDGSHSYVEDTNAGNLYLKSNGAEITLRDGSNTSMIRAFTGGGVRLFNNGTERLEVTSTGIDVTGTAVTDGVTVAGNILLQTEGNELQFNTSSTPVNKIYSDDTYTSNGLTISADNGVALKSTNNYLLLDDTGTNEMVLNVDSGERMRVTSTGIDVTGNIDVTGAGVRRIDISNTSLADAGEMATLQWDANADLTFQGRSSTGGFKANWYRIEASDSDGFADAHRFYTDSSVERMNITSTGIAVTGDISATDAIPALNLYDSDNSTRTNLTNNTGTSYLTAYGVASGTYGSLIVNSSDHVTTKEIIRADNTNIQFKTDGTLRGRFLSNGDYALYNDAATSTDFYWDASTSRLGIGTSLPLTILEIEDVQSQLTIDSTGSSFSRVIHQHNGTSLWTTGTRSASDYHIFRESGSGDVIIDYGNVGIGDSAPVDRLTVSRLGNTWTGVTPNASTAALLHPGTTSAGSGSSLTIAGNSTAQSNIYFSSDTDNDVGGIFYSHASDGMFFRVNGSDRMSIASTGSISVNGDSINAQTYSSFYLRNRVNGGSLNLGVETSAGALYYPITANGASNITIFRNATTEIARFISNGYLGIDTPSPSDPLTIGHGDVSSMGLGIKSTNTGNNYIHFGDTDSASSGRIMYDHNADNMQFNTGGTLRGFYSSGGLTITANNGSSSHMFTFNENGGEIQLYNNAGQIATLIDQVSNATRILELINGSAFQIGHGSTNTTGIIEFRSAGFGLAGVIDANANWTFNTTSTSGTSGAGVKITRPNTSGNDDGKLMIVGESSTSAQDGLQLYSTGASAYRFFVNYAGSIYATSTSITAISDESLKENIRDLDKGLDTVLGLQPRRFDWKNGDGNDIMGFVAQEVEEVMPELVHDYKYSETETKLGLKMGDMVPTLVKAIQDQQEIIDNLKSRIEQLEGAN